MFERIKISAPLATILGNVLLHECADFCRINSLDDKDSATTMAIPTVDFDTNAITPACGHFSPCVKMIRADCFLWKTARLTYHQFLMATVLMHLEQKRNFGRLMIEVNQCLWYNYIHIF
jgi:hypothetical protein